MAMLRHWFIAMGKAALDESHPQFSGCYIGSVSMPEVKELVESADFVLSVGSLRSDCE